jgi:hypothetical protein
MTLTESGRFRFCGVFDPVLYARKSGFFGQPSVSLKRYPDTNQNFPAALFTRAVTGIGVRGRSF